MSRRVPPLVLAVPLLGVARLLPDHGFAGWLWLRLAAATLVLLLPGRLVARALGHRGPSEAFAWSVALVAGALAVTFAVHASLDLTLVLVLLAGVVALPFSWRPQRGSPALHGRGLAALAGLGLGIALWPVTGPVRGDGLFHLARIRKLDDFGGLSLHAVDEFRDGGLHPGYAFPLWHGWLALIARLAGVDPTSVVLHESSVLAPLAVVLAFEVGRHVFDSAWLGLATAAAQVALIALAPGAGGSYTSLELPGTAARQLLVPAATALFFRYVRAPSWPLALTLGAAGLDLGLVHPTYALFVAIPLAGFAVARLLVAGVDGARSAGALAAFGVPVALVFAWLAPIVADTRAYNPAARERARGLIQYASDLVIHSPGRYHLAAGNVARTGAVATAALVLVPLAAFAGRRRWSAFVLGGTALVLVLELSSLVFPHFSDLVSLSQSRRAAGFVPFAVAFAGGAAVLTRALRLLVLPASLAAGIVLQREFPGNFSLHPASTGPGLATWIALFGGLSGLVAAALLVRSRAGGRFEQPGPVAALAPLLFVIPVAVHAGSHWNRPPALDRDGLSGGLIRFLRSHVPERAVVLADPATSYRIAAYAPVYVVAAPASHVADTKANEPRLRMREVDSVLRSGDVAQARRLGADWIVLRQRERVDLAARALFYSDRRYRVYRLVPSTG